MRIEEAAAELLAAPLGDFTARRAARARELKAAGQGALAAQVNGLRKPPLALWAVNQLARRDEAALDRLGRAGGELVRAQQVAVRGSAGAAGELRRASTELQRELQLASSAAGAALREDGHAADEAMLRRLQEILRVAAVSGGESWAGLRQGALLTEPRAGEDLLTAAFAVGTAAPRPHPSPVKGERVKALSAKQKRTREEKAAQRRLDAERVARTARADAEQAQQAAATARRLRQQADAMAADARRAQLRAREAERELEQATAKARASAAKARRLRGKSAVHADSQPRSTA
ncbi:MAG: hypothetical protein E6J00_10375 [Chloroflexi bacterium]|nr:MAG: hypothetical protein E6J00_10375 [Chloroflexota bacterium]